MNTFYCVGFFVFFPELSEFAVVTSTNLSRQEEERKRDEGIERECRENGERA